MAVQDSRGYTVLLHRKSQETANPPAVLQPAELHTSYFRGRRRGRHSVRSGRGISAAGSRAPFWRRRLLRHGLAHGPFGTVAAHAHARQARRREQAKAAGPCGNDASELPRRSFQILLELGLG